MDQFIPVVGTMALLGSALAGGIFFTFSSFIMKALAGVPSAEGIGAMQSINSLSMFRKQPIKLVDFEQFE